MGSSIFLALLASVQPCPLKGMEYHSLGFIKAPCTQHRTKAPWREKDGRGVDLGTVAMSTLSINHTYDGDDTLPSSADLKVKKTLNVFSECRSCPLAPAGKWANRGIW